MATGPFTGSDLFLEAASQYAVATIKLKFSQFPLATSSSGTHDALNPNNYTIYGPNALTVTRVTPVAGDPQSFCLLLSNPLTEGTWIISAANIQTSNGDALVPPTTINFVASLLSTQAPLSGGGTNDSAADVLRKHLNPSLKGENWDAVIAGLAAGDEYLSETAQLAFKQLFLSTASGKYLARKASDNGFTKPQNVGLDDEVFRKLAIVVSAEKVTLQSFLQVLETYYGPDAIRATADSVSDTYNLQNGDDLIIDIDGKTVTVIFVNDDFQQVGFAKAAEVAAKITRAFELAGITAFAKGVRDVVNSQNYVRIYSGALGLRGYIRVLGGKAQNQLKFPESLNTTQAIGTTWQIDTPATIPSLAANRARYTWTGGTNPSLNLVHIGDYANIYGSIFTSDNRGAYTIVAITGTYFEIVSPTAAVQGAMAQLAVNDISFYRPVKNTVNSKLRSSLAAQGDPDLTDVILAATTQAVTRHSFEASYLHANTSLSLMAPLQATSVVRASNVVTVTFNKNHSLSIGDTFFLGPGDPGNTKLFTSQVYTVTAVPAANQIRYAQTAANASAILPQWVFPCYRTASGTVNIKTNTAHQLQSNNKLFIDGLNPFYLTESPKFSLDTGSSVFSLDRSAAVKNSNNAVIVIGGDSGGHTVGINTRAAWHLDESTGTSPAFDATGSYNLTSVIGTPTVTTGFGGYARVFNGTPYIKGTIDSAFVNQIKGPNWTLGFWATPGAGVESGLGISVFGIGEFSDIATNNICYLKFAFNRMFFGNQVSGNAAFSAAATNLIAGTRYFIVLSRSGGVLTGYINGVSQGTCSGVISSLTPTTPAFYLGRGQAAASNYVGTLDDVWVENTAWNATQIQNEYLNALAGGLQSLVQKYEYTTRTWSTLSSMGTARSQHTATLLNNGRILVTGGGSNSAEIYDSNLNIWINTSSMTSSRTGHTATLLNDGRVLVSGGISPVAASEIYNPNTGTWTSAAIPSDVRIFGKAIKLNDGRVLVSGGFNGAISLNTCEIYNPANDTWTTVAPMNSTRYSHTLNSIDLGTSGIILATGGYIDNGVTTTNTCEVYNPGKNTWTTVASMATARADHASAVLSNGYILVANGAGTSISAISDVSIYNPFDNIWSNNAISNTSAKATNQAFLLPDKTVILTPSKLGGGSPETIFTQTNPASDGGLNGIFNITYLNANTLSYSTPNYSVESGIDTENSDLIPIVAKEDPKHIGPYLLDPNEGYGITGISTVTTQLIVKDNDYLTIAVADASDFNETGGYLLFAFGNSAQTGPVKYIFKPSSSELIIDSSFIFPYNLPIGTSVIQLNSKSPFNPAHAETLGAFYLTDSIAGRISAEKTIDQIAATGAHINKTILYPGSIGLGNSQISPNTDNITKINDIVYIFGSQEEIDNIRNGDD